MSALKEQLTINRASLDLTMGLIKVMEAKYDLLVKISESSQNKSDEVTKLLADTMEETIKSIASIKV